MKRLLCFIGIHEPQINIVVDELIEIDVYCHRCNVLLEHHFAYKQELKINQPKCLLKK